MTSPDSLLAGILMLFACLLSVAILVLWVLLPFAVFGIKRRLDSLIWHQRRTNELIEQTKDFPPQ